MNNALIQLNSEYAAAIDDDRLEDWPAFFLDDCFYRVTTSNNYQKKMQAGLIYADSRAMLRDRVLSLRKANVYEAQRYRHIVSLPRIIKIDADGLLHVETPFVVMRIVRNGATDVFATGRYIDQVATGQANALLKSREVVCDSARIDTLLAMPL
jgi:3-phenylpropionate/cinnamic acid dioxygenase small subunit